MKYIKVALTVGFTVNVIGCYVWTYIDALSRMPGAKQLSEAHAMGVCGTLLIAFCCMPFFIKD